MNQQELELLSVNTIRMLSIDAVQKANSGHPGLPMGAASMAFVLWTRFLKHNPANPLWPDRDRFVLSAGHGSALLYSLLHLTGYNLPMDELKRFRQWGSRTPGHPERSHHTPGVEVSTGPLGQGFANGVGMAMAEAWLSARFNRPDWNIVDHHTYGIVSDGDLMEGITAEAASLAGHLQLGKLIYLYDQNEICLAGSTNLSFTEDVRARFEAYGWHTRVVQDGNDLADVDAAICEAKNEANKPSLLLVRNHIGFGSPKKHDTFHAHGSPLGEEEVAATKAALGWPSQEPFFIPDEALHLFRGALDAGKQSEQAWSKKLDCYLSLYPEQSQEWQQIMVGGLPSGWKDSLPSWTPQDKPISTRVAGGQILNALADRIPNLVGGSADLNPSTNTAMKEKGDFEPPTQDKPTVQGAVGGAWDYSGRNINFGIREHAMGAAVNGMAAHGGLLPFSATFMVFSDYMKPAIRLGAMMGVKAVYVFTHDSIAVGEDGPTHEPIEQLAGLRAIPGLTVLRPADANEAREAWALAIERPTPTVLVMSRQNLDVLNRSGATKGLTERGAYVLTDAEEAPEVILVGTGSEVNLCVKAAARLGELGVSARVVSMPSWEIFHEQSPEYRESVLPSACRKRVTVEAASTFGWEKFAGLDGCSIGIDQFGASAPATEIMARFGFTAQHVTAAALQLMNRLEDAEKEAKRNEDADTAVAATSSTEGHS